MARLFMAVALIAFVSCFSGSATQAEALKSEQIKALISGNTLFHDRPNARGRPRQTWLTFNPDGTLVQKTVVERRRDTRERETQSKWQVKPGGILCWQDRSDQDNCYTNVEVKGGTLRGKRNRDGETRDFQIQKAK